MPPDEIALVKQTFNKIMPIKESVAQMFYDKLFELDPSIRPMFKADLTQQKHILMSTLAMIVGNLDRPATLLPMVHGLGRRHSGYGVQSRHYELVGQALLWTLEQGLGAAFTPAVRRAWTSAYLIASETMRAAGSKAA